MEHLGDNFEEWNLKIKDISEVLRANPAKPMLHLDSSDNVSYANLKAALF